MTNDLSALVVQPHYKLIRNKITIHKQTRFNTENVIYKMKYIKYFSTIKVNQKIIAVSRGAFANFQNCYFKNSAVGPGLWKTENTSPQGLGPALVH